MQRHNANPKSLQTWIFICGQNSWWSVQRYDAQVMLCKNLGMLNNFVHMHSLIKSANHFLPYCSYKEYATI